MKRALIIGLAFGLGVGLALGLAVGVVLLGRTEFDSWRAAHPLPWNTAAITATFDYIDIEGPDNKLVFCYILENHTDQDFRIASPSDIAVLARLRDQNGLIAGHPGETIASELPLFLPARNAYAFASTWAQSATAMRTRDRCRQKRPGTATIVAVLWQPT